jgi:hypothetical protein
MNIVAIVILSFGIGYAADTAGVRISAKIPQHGHNDMTDGGVLKNTGGYNDDTIYYHTLFEGSSGYGLVGSGTITTGATWVSLSTGSVVGQYISMVKDPEWSATPTWTKNRRFKAIVKFDNIDANTTVILWSGIISKQTASVPAGGGGGFGKPSPPAGCTYDRTNGIGFKLSNGVLYGCSAEMFTGDALTIPGAACGYTLISQVSSTTTYILEAVYKANPALSGLSSFYVNNVLKGYALYTPVDDYSGVGCKDGFPQNIFNIFIRTDAAENKVFSVSEYKFLQERIP